MTGLLGVTVIFSFLYSPEEKEIKNQTNDEIQKLDVNKKNSSTKSMQQLNKEFYSFRNKYVLVYLIIMLADWMQGTHMYTLYLSYGVNISTLFITGFLAGAIFAPFLGSFVDQFGRKRSCIVYCILEIIINTLEHYDNFTLLLIGRVLGGISTNLLFSSFESWMTTEHRKLGFPEEWLSRTYSLCSIGNGSMAIMAGIVAQVLEDHLGHIGPFQGAIGLTVLALVLVMTSWDENYGEEHVGDHKDSSLTQTFYDGWTKTISDSYVWRIGLTQALSEGAMYTFVFMWVPTLMSLKPPGGVPTGCVFSSLMMAITIGGIMYPTLHAFVSYLTAKSSIGDNANEICATMIYLLASISMAVPVVCVSSLTSSLEKPAYCQEMILGSFLIVELCVGLFMPVAGTLRSKYVPDSLQGAILNIFRLPLNIIVVSGTYATDHYPPSTVFQLVSGCFLIASLLQATMVFPRKQIASSTTTTKKTN